MSRLSIHSARQYSYPFLECEWRRRHASTPQTVHGLRLIAKTRIGNNPQAHHTRSPQIAVLDTGATISIFPYHIWAPYVGEIQWMYRPVPPPSGWKFPVTTDHCPELIRIPHFDDIVLRRSTVRGATCYAFLGKIAVSVSDGLGNRLAPRSTLALFQCNHHFDPNLTLKEPLLGLEWGVLDGRRLVRDTMQFHNQDAELANHPDDHGPQHNQLWHLSQP